MKRYILPFVVFAVGYLVVIFNDAVFQLTLSHPPIAGNILWVGMMLMAIGALSFGWNLGWKEGWLQREWKVEDENVSLICKMIPFSDATLDGVVKLANDWLADNREKVVQNTIEWESGRGTNESFTITLFYEERVKAEDDVPNN